MPLNLAGPSAIVVRPPAHSSSSEGEQSG